MRPTSADLKGLWLHAYSRSSLIQADRWVADVETRNSQSPIPCTYLRCRGRICATFHKLQNRSASSPLTECRLSLGE